MKELSDLIVKRRDLILLVAVLLLISSAIEHTRMEVGYGLLSYLLQDVESIIRQKLLGDNFSLASTGMLVVENMPDKDVSGSKKEIRVIDDVKDVPWRDDILDISAPKETLSKDVHEMLHSDKGTLVVITFQGEISSQRMMDATKIIKGRAGRRYYLGGSSAITGDTKDLMNEETPLYAVATVILCMIALFMGPESSTAPLVLVLGAVPPIVHNLGTNVFLGQISYITRALALVPQLDVTMGYSIFLLHRYQGERKKSSDRDEAMSSAAQAIFTSIISSSIMTVAGSLTLYVMQLTLGRDIGIVMAEGIVFGVLSIIIILPVLLMLFDKCIEKWKYPIPLKEPKKLPGSLTRHCKTILVAFVVTFIPIIYAQAHTNVYYDLNTTMSEDFPSVIGTNKLRDQPHMTMMYFLLVDEELESYEIKEVCDSVGGLPGICSATSYESLIGGGIPNELEPAVVKSILQDGDGKMISINGACHFATGEEDEQLNKTDAILHKYNRRAVIAREGLLTRDLITMTDISLGMMNILSVAAIFLIIAITFKSPALPIILVASIELAICINMGTPSFTRTTLSSIANIVIGTTQLGAAVDYIILMIARYKEEFSNGNTVIEATREAAAKSVSSIITSRLSFFAACIGVSFISKMGLVKSLCILISRGAVISMLSIPLVLPVILIMLHKLIEKTTKDWPKTNLKQGGYSHEEKYESSNACGIKYTADWFRHGTVCKE